MSKNEKIKSIDQFYADKLSEGSTGLSPEAGWDMFEAQHSTNSNWTLPKKLLVLIAVLAIGFSLVLNFNSTEQKESLSSIYQSKNDFNTKINRTNNQQQISINTEILIDKNDINILKDDDFSTSLTRIETPVLENQQRGSNSLASSQVVNKENSLNNQATNHLKSNYDKSNTTSAVGQKSKSQNEKPSSLNYENIDEQTARGASLHNSGDSRSSSGKLTKVYEELRNEILYEQLAILQQQLFKDERMVNSLKLVHPINTNKPSKWSIDLGFSLNKEYELSETFQLETVSNRLRVSHIALGYNHLITKYYTTRAYLSYDKIYGAEQFVGQRIVRTYDDDNVSLGYSINLKLSRRLGFESSLSLGISLIDKIEFEQKPTWVDGMQEYKDYTRSTFSMDPVPTYQSHSKLMYQLPYILDIYLGATYRAQFANSLTSTDTNRENTLEKFAHLQLLIGMRYHIN